MDLRGGLVAMATRLGTEFMGTLISLVWEYV